MAEGRFEVVQLSGSFGFLNGQWVVWDRQVDRLAWECECRSEAEEMVEQWNRDCEHRAAQEKAAAYRRSLEAYLTD